MGRARLTPFSLSLIERLLDSDTIVSHLCEPQVRRHSRRDVINGKSKPCSITVYDQTDFMSFEGAACPATSGLARFLRLWDFQLQVDHVALPYTSPRSESIA